MRASRAFRLLWSVRLRRPAPVVAARPRGPLDQLLLDVYTAPLLNLQPYEPDPRD